MEELGFSGEAEEHLPWTLCATRSVLEASVNDVLTRRRLAQLTGVTLGAYLLEWITAEPQLEDWKPRATAASLEPGVATALERRLDRLWRLDARSGDPSLRGRSEAVLSTGIELLRSERYDRSTGRRLYLVCSSSAALAAWCCYDVGNLVDADRLFDAALRASHAAEDPSFGAFVASIMAIRHYMAGAAHDAVKLAAAARTRVDGESTPHLVAALYLIEARSYAAAGDGGKASKCVDRAQASLQQGPSAKEPWQFLVSQGEFYGQAGSALLQLGDYRASAEYFNRATRSYAASEVRSRSLHEIRRATALAFAGNVDEAYSATFATRVGWQGVRSQRFGDELRGLEAQLRVLPRTTESDEVLNAMRASGSPSTPDCH
jgi:tetratricopeptide (TPR) repeat protein